MSWFYELLLHKSGWTFITYISTYSPDYKNHIIEVITLSYHAEIGQ